MEHPGHAIIKATNPKIIFMGTPEFAVSSLDALIQAGFDVIAVITAPDKPAGRGMKLNESAVKKFAVANGLRLLQPEKLKNPDFLELLRSLKADLQVVVAFRMLPEQVWNMPPMGTINLHASLLPQYRGAAPINWAVINGETETGLTTFKLQQEIDTGNILLQEKISIGENETAGELHDRMKIIGAGLLVKTVAGLASGSLEPQPQLSFTDANGQSQLRYAPKIFTETCRIDWTKPVDNVHNLIRGLSPFPGAFTSYEGKMMKVFRAHKELARTSGNPGISDTDKKTFVRFEAANGFIYFDEIQLEGKKKMHITDFLRGWRWEKSG